MTGPVVAVGSSQGSGVAPDLHGFDRDEFRRNLESQSG